MAVDRRALADPRFLLATAVLLANDRWAKAAHGNWLTGKLSDISGLLVAGVLVAVVLGRWERSRPGVVALGLWFAAIKTAPAAAAATVALGDAVLPWSNAIVVDPTDLIAVPVLLAVRPIVERPVVWWTARTARVVGFLVAAGAAVATSEPDLVGDDLAIDESGAIVGYTYSGAGPDDAYQTSTCRPSDAARCWRIHDLTIEETVDGGDSWHVVWEVDIDSPATFRAEAVHALDRGDLGPRDIVASETEVHASFDGLDPVVVRAADGSWTPTPGSFRALPRLALAGQVVVVVVAGTALAAVAVRWRRGLRGTGLLAFVTLGSLVVAELILMAGMRSAAALLPVELLVVVPLLALLVACGLALMEPTRLWRSLSPVGRGLLAAALVAGLTLPPVPLLRWSAGGAPAYGTATLLSVGAATALVVLAGVVGAASARPAD